MLWQWRVCQGGVPLPLHTPRRRLLQRGTQSWLDCTPYDFTQLTLVIDFGVVSYFVSRGFNLVGSHYTLQGTLEIQTRPLPNEM